MPPPLTRAPSCRPPTCQTGTRAACWHQTCRAAWTPPARMWTASGAKAERTPGQACIAPAASSPEGWLLATAHAPPPPTHPARLSPTHTLVRKPTSSTDLSTHTPTLHCQNRVFLRARGAGPGGRRQAQAGRPGTVITGLPRVRPSLHTAAPAKPALLTARAALSSWPGLMPATAVVARRSLRASD